MQKRTPAASTDNLGVYNLLNLELGTYEVTASIEDLDSETARVQVLVADEIAEANFTLVPPSSEGKGEGEGEGEGSPPPTGGGCAGNTSNPAGINGDLLLLAMTLLLLARGHRRRTQ